MIVPRRIDNDSEEPNHTTIRLPKTDQRTFGGWGPRFPR